MAVSAQTFRFDTSRLWRNFLGLIPLAGFPVVLHLSGDLDRGLYILFGAIGLVFIGGVLFTAARFKMVIDADGISCTGRVKTRRIAFSDVTSAYVRVGRDKAGRFMGPPPFRELVLVTQDKNLVISSLPLGSTAFDALLSRLADALPEEVLAEQPPPESS